MIRVVWFHAFAHQGLSCVVNHLLNKKQGHVLVVVFNLREDLVVECDGATYSPRESDRLEEPIIMPGISSSEIQVCEYTPGNTRGQSSEVSECTLHTTHILSIPGSSSTLPVSTIGKQDEIVTEKWHAVHTNWMEKNTEDRWSSFLTAGHCLLPYYTNCQCSKTSCRDLTDEVPCSTTSSSVSHNHNIITIIIV